MVLWILNQEFEPITTHNTFRLLTSFFLVSRCITISLALLPDMETFSSCCRLTISGGFSSFAAFNFAFTSDNEDFLSDEEEEDDFDHIEQWVNIKARLIADPLLSPS